MRILKLRKYLFSSESFLLISGGLLFVCANLINLSNKKPILNLKKQDTAVNVNNNLLLFINAGNKRLITDLLWVQTLIESDDEHYKKKDLNNWLFHRFLTISILDPKFYENYLYGGQFLAIIKDDLEGANYLYDKGLIFFTNDYRLNFNAGFLNYYEIGNYKKGLELLEKVVNNKEAPIYLRSILNKLKAATGVRLEEVYNLVLYNLETSSDAALKNKLKKDLYAIKAEIDLRCLNNKQLNCNYIDFEGNSYIRNGDFYFSARKFVPYKINKREANPLPSHEKQINYIK
jgi:hypothetical protein